MKFTNILLIVIVLLSCDNKVDEKVEGDWITGSEEAKLEAIERQFRGFDMAMVETGYRYQELYWAGQDENWEYADYQLEKIRKAIENGLERRPKRAKSAAHFLSVTLDQMKEVIQAQDTIRFNKEFNTFTNSCNNCHAMEEVSHFTVKKPLTRQSPIR